MTRSVPTMDTMPSNKFVLENVGAVIFDWDGVLVDSSRNYYRAYELALHEVGVTATPREIYLREGQPTPEVIAAICTERGMPLSGSTIEELVERRREYDIALGPRTYYPGMWPMLYSLKQSGFKLAIVTGSSRKSVVRILSPGEARVFDVVITADDVVHGKPDPEPFRKAAAALGMDPSRCLVVENAPFGVQAARAASCPVVALCTTLAPEDLSEADLVLKDHRDLEQLFQARSRK